VRFKRINRCVSPTITKDLEQRRFSLREARFNLTQVSNWDATVIDSFSSVFSVAVELDGYIIPFAPFHVDTVCGTIKTL
jgi:hypothetical protein